MSQKWNLQDIRPPEREKKSAARKRAPAQTPRRTDFTPHRSSVSFGGKRNYLLIGGIVVLVGFVLFVLSGFMRGAEIIVHPKEREVKVQATFTAYNNPEAGQLAYEVFTVEKVGERRVTASGEEEASERARGTITVFNEFSSSPQRLIKNTRFESEGGLIFRIPESVEVPGLTKENDGSITPGSLSVEVFADEPGDTYNIDPDSFTIPGLKGTDQFDDMYARSTKQMAGGFEGMRFIVEENTLLETQRDIRAELEEELTDRFKNERPAGTIVFDRSTVVGQESLPSLQAGGDQVTIREKVMVRAPLFLEADFAQYLAENTISGYSDEPVRIQNPEEIGFSYAGTGEVDLDSTEEIEFALSGDAHIVWTYDAGALKGDLMGAAKTALPSILGGYPAIERAEAHIKPFWRQSFPEDSDEITLKEVLGE